MERLKKRVYAMAACFIIAGVAISLIPRKANSEINEAWMEDKTPMQLTGYQFDASTDNPKQSYKMDPGAYALLRPYGIVSRRYVGRGVSYDVVVIASNDDASFHDPRICFSAQGWTIESERQVTIDAGERGQVPISLVTMSSAGQKGQLAAYFYKTPTGYKATTAAITMSILFGPMTGNFNIDGVFYRFMGVEGDISEEDLKAFIVKYLNAAGKTSNGYF